jgi:hypothetical protein
MKREWPPPEWLVWRPPGLVLGVLTADRARPHHEMPLARYDRMST